MIALVLAQWIALANPASVYCVEQGGRSVIVRDDKGNEHGLSQWPDGRSIEEWAFFRARNQPPEQKN